MQVGIDSFAAFDDAGMSLNPSERLRRLVEQIEYADKIGPEGGDTERYERWSRLPLEYNSGVMRNIATLRTAWIRPWYFYYLDAEDAESLEKQFPRGVAVSIIGDTIVEKKKERLDDKWTISFDPRSN